MNKVHLVSIVIPTYNEKLNIIPLIKEISHELSGKKISFEIIVVDDDSRDGTEAEILREFKRNKNVRLFVRKKERGLATAILYGLQQARGKIIVGMDADFNHPPKLIPELIRGLEHADLVIASRFIKGGGMEDQKRFILTFIFNLFLKYFLAFPTMDNMSGFYAIKKNKLFSLPVNKIYAGYGEYHLRLVYLAKKNKFKITETPVFYKRRPHGKSKTNFFKYFFIYLWTALKMRFSVKE